MKKLIIASLLVVGLTTYAQEEQGTKKKSGKGSTEMKSPEQRSEVMLAKMTTELNLDAKQQEQIKPILAVQTVKLEEMKAKQMANKEAGIQPTDEDKMVMRKKMKEEKEATDAKFKAILTPEQFSQYQEMQKEQRGKMMSQKKPKAD